jgi:hypothetical protein
VIENIFIAYTQDLVPKLLQPLVSLHIPLRLSRPAMNSTVNFNNDSDFMTIKVDNVAIYWNLTAKFQPQRSAILQLRPRLLLRTGFVAPHLACTLRQFRRPKFWTHCGTPHPALRATLSRREREMHPKFHPYFKSKFSFQTSSIMPISTSVQSPARRHVRFQGLRA